jgi:Tellurite resistance protein TerB.
MEPFFETALLGLNHVQVIVRGLYTVATCDDVHHTEHVLIRSFYDACRKEVAGLADFEDIVGQGFDAEQATEILNTPALRRTFLKSCLLLAFADGKYSKEEQAKIGEFARALGVDDATLAELKEQVTEHLFSQIAGIENIDALREVTHELSS